MFEVKIDNSNKVIKSNIPTINEASKIAIDYIKKYLQEAKFNTNISNELSNINIYTTDVEDKDNQQIFDQELENFKALNNLFIAPNLKISKNNNNYDNYDKGEENTPMDINYNAFDMNNDWDAIAPMTKEEETNASIFKENYVTNLAPDIMRDYLADEVDKGYGYVTLSKMRDDLDYIYNIQMSEEDVRDWCNSKDGKQLCHLFTLGGIEVVLTKSAPSFDIIAKDLGLTEGVDYNTLDEEIQPDQKYPVKSPISEDIDNLTEKTWEYKIPVNIVKDLADASDVGDLNGMSDGLIKCYKWINENVPDDLYDEDNFESDEEYLSGLKIEYFEDEDELEEEIDYAIDNFYDLCDALSIWVPNHADIAIEDDNDDNGNKLDENQNSLPIEDNEYAFSKYETKAELLLDDFYDNDDNGLEYKLIKSHKYYVDFEPEYIMMYSITGDNLKINEAFAIVKTEGKGVVEEFETIESAEEYWDNFFVEDESLEEDTNINIDKMEVEIGSMKNKSCRVDNENPQYYDCDDSFDYDRDEFKNKLLKDGSECPSIEEDFASEQSSEIKKDIQDKKEETSKEKWNIGSNKSNLTSEEINKLKELAKMLQDNSPNGWKYTVEKTYEDFGAGMQWYTIICYDNNGNDWQVLNTKEWLDLMNNTSDINTVYNEIINGKYFQDKKQKGKIDLWKWDI